MKQHLYVIEVEKPEGPTLVGPWYVDKAVCKSWVSFVKKFHYGARTRVRRFSRDAAQEIQNNGGQLAIRQALEQQAEKL